MKQLIIFLGLTLSVFQACVAMDSTLQFHTAIKNGALSDAKKLYVRGANINGRDGATGLTALHMATETENSVVVSWLLQKQAEVTLKDRAGNTALHIAVQKNLLKIATMLLEAGASVDSKNAVDDTPLHIAARGGADYTAMIGLLLLRNAHTDIKNKNGHTAYDEADDYVRTNVAPLKPKTTERLVTAAQTTAQTVAKKVGDSLMQKYGFTDTQDVMNGLTDVAAKAVVRGIDQATPKAVKDVLREAGPKPADQWSCHVIPFKTIMLPILPKNGNRVA